MLPHKIVKAQTWHLFPLSLSTFSIRIWKKAGEENLHVYYKPQMWLSQTRAFLNVKQKAFKRNRSCLGAVQKIHCHVLIKSLPQPSNMLLGALQSEGTKIVQKGDDYHT